MHMCYESTKRGRIPASATAYHQQELVQQSDISPRTHSHAVSCDAEVEMSALASDIDIRMCCCCSAVRP
jgi:hypothetical protein